MGIRILDFSDGFTSATSPTELDVLLPLTTKGDLLIRDNTEIVRFPIGTNGKFLQADSTQDEGMLWADRPANFNYVINGNFDFWQRGTSLSSGTGVRYLADRIRTFSEVTTYEVSRQSFTLGQTDVPNEPIYFLRNIVTSGSTSASRCLITITIEDVRTLAGQTATFSFWAKADSNKNISIEFNQFFGSGGSPSATVNTLGVEKFAITSSWQKIIITFAIPSISGKTLGTDNNSSLRGEIWLDAGSNFDSRTDSLGNQSGTFDIAQVKLEKGSYATDFTLAGGNLAGELNMCQRYFQRFGTNSGTHVIALGYAVSTTELRVCHFLSNPLRSPPSVNSTNIANIRAIGIGIAPVAESFSNINYTSNRNNLNYSATFPAVLTANNIYALTAGASFIELDAEI